jgi:hypothetical protein
MTVAEGGSKRAVIRKFQEVYIPTLKANYLIWPVAQMLNFRVLPIQFQVVCLSTYLLNFTYIYIYICVCVCVCV